MRSKVIFNLDGMACLISTSKSTGTSYQSFNQKILRLIRLQAGTGKMKGKDCSLQSASSFEGRVPLNPLDCGDAAVYYG